MSASMVGGVLLHQWGLIEEVPDDADPQKKKAGFYRVTERGVQFVRGEIRVNKFVYLYDNRLLNISGDTETVSMQEALGDRFDYQELMTA